MHTPLSQRTERTAMLLGETRMQLLLHAHGMIFGLGGVGSYAAEALCRLGVGKLTIVDGDRYEASNINRQLCAFTSTVGQSKAAITAERLQDINPDAEIVPIKAFYLPSEPVPIPDDVDFVVDAIDTVAAKLDIITICKERAIPVISCMGMGNRLDPTRIAIGDLFETRNCALSRVMRKEFRKRGIPSLRCVYSTEEAVRCTCSSVPKGGKRAIPGSLVYVPSVAGLYMAYDIVNTLWETAEPPAIQITDHP